MPAHVYALRVGGDAGSSRVDRPPLTELPALLSDPSVRLWVDVEGSTDADMELMRDVLLLHPLLIEDAFKAQDTPKLEVHADYLYAIVHGPLREQPSPEAIELADVDIFLGERFCVTHHEGGVAALAKVRREVEHSADLLAKGPAAIAHRVVDIMIDRFLAEMNELGEALDDLELKALHGRGADVLEAILARKHDVLAVGRLVRHQREVLRTLALGGSRFIPESQRPFFRDVFDHFVTLSDRAEGYRDMVSDALDAYLSMQSHRLNEVMKVLTLISTIMLPLTFITGLYGMNFDHMPGLHHRYGYEMAWGTMLAIAAAAFLYFKRKNWW